MLIACVGVRNKPSRGRDETGFIILLWQVLVTTMVPGTRVPPVSLPFPKECSLRPVTCPSCRCLSGSGVPSSMSLFSLTQKQPGICNDGNTPSYFLPGLPAQNVLHHGSFHVLLRDRFWRAGGDAKLIVQRRGIIVTIGPQIFLSLFPRKIYGCISTFISETAVYFGEVSDADAKGNYHWKRNANKCARLKTRSYRICWALVLAVGGHLAEAYFPSVIITPSRSSRFQCAIWRMPGQNVKGYSSKLR